MRATLYFRQSVDNAEGIDRQRERTSALAAARGWTVVAEYADNDTSASKARGPETQWGQMLAAADRDEFEVVIAVDLDRLLRTTRDLNTLIDLGLKVVTVDGEIDLSTADGEFRATMLAGIARFEGRRRHERQVRAYEHRAQQGHQVGGWRPFGYRDGEVVPEEAHAIREGYQSLLSGAPLAQIAREWNTLGLRTVHGSEWRHGSVRKVLLNPRNTGAVTYRGAVIAREGRSPAIVDEATFLAASAVLKDPSRRSAATSGRRLLSGLGVCGVCGATVHAGGSNEAGKANYRCSASMGHVARRAEPVEAFVSEVVVARLSRADAGDLLLRADSENDTTALQAEAHGVRERMNKLSAGWAVGTLTDEQVTTASKTLQERLAVLEAEMADAGRVDVLGPLVGAEDVRAAWDAAGVARQRAIVQELMQVTIHPPGRGARTFDPESVSIAWRS